jgi:hypothetical protein
MVSRRVIGLVVVFSLLSATSSLAITEQFEAGTGQNIANVYFEWSDGYSAQFLIRFEPAMVTGTDLLDIVEAYTDLTTVRLYSGTFINGISFNGHSDVGYHGDANWWHYWTMNSGEADWASPAFGAASREVYNGDSDGWVYGRDTVPTPEPSSILLLGVGGMILSRMRCRIS